MNEPTTFPVHDPEPRWFYPVWAAAVVITVVVCVLINGVA